MERYCSIERVETGQDAESVMPGDFLLLHRRGFVSGCIRIGERIRNRRGSVVSHAAICETSDVLIEALTHGVTRTPLSHYRDTEYWIVRTGLHGDDAVQAVTFARTCLYRKYGFLTDLGVLLRFLTPGRGLWFGMDGTEICSGLVAQAMVRGWVIFEHEPSSMSPSELFEYYSQDVV